MNFVKYFVILFLFAPAHIKIIGVFADSSSFINVFSIFSSITGLLILTVSNISTSFSFISSHAISSGNSICTAPGLSSSAIFIALLNVYVKRDGETILVVYLVTGFIIDTISTIWKAHCFDFLIGFCPVITNTGIHHN